MIGKKSVMTAVALLAMAYAVTPYVTIWRLTEAVERGDTRMLSTTIDWNSVRAGLKEDIADGIVGMSDNAAVSEPEAASNTLPPFGASFISGIAGSVVDREVTPEHLAALLRQLAPAEKDAGFSLPFSSVRHAFFEGPTSFLLSVQCPGQEPGDPPLRVRLALRGGEWKVVRAWVPQDLIDLADSRT